MRRLLVAASVFLMAGSALAADPASEALFKEARKQYDANDFVTALDSFKAVYARTNSPAALLGVATTLKALSRFAEAADAYERYLADPRANPAKRAETEQALNESLQNVATLHIDAGPTARLTVDAREVKATARVDAGVHVVVADDGSDAPETVQITVKAGEERNVALQRQATAAENGSAQKAEQATPAAPIGPSPGRTGTATFGYAVGGFGLAAFAAGGVFGLMALSKHSEFAQTPTRSTYDTGRRDALLADVGVGVGVVALAAGIYLVATSSTEAKTGFVVLPHVAPGGGGVAMRSAW